MKTDRISLGLKRISLKKKKKSPIGKIIGISAGIAAIASVFPYRIDISEDKRSFGVKTLALHIFGDRDENNEWNIDINIPWLKSRCSSCPSQGECGEDCDKEDI